MCTTKEIDRQDKENYPTIKQISAFFAVSCFHENPIVKKYEFKSA
jgi:hypothetical protein